MGRSRTLFLLPQEGRSKEGCSSEEPGGVAETVKHTF